MASMLKVFHFPAGSVTVKNELAELWLYSVLVYARAGPRSCDYLVGLPVDRLRAASRSLRS